MVKSEITCWIAWFVDVPQTKVTRYISFNTEWEELPRDGMIACAFISDREDGGHSKWKFSGYDFYFKADGINGPIYGCDIEQREVDKKKDIAERYVNASIIRGMWTDEDTMYEIQQIIRRME